MDLLKFKFDLQRFATTDADLVIYSTTATVKTLAGMRAALNNTSVSKIVLANNITVDSGGELTVQTVSGNNTTNHGIDRTLEIDFSGYTLTYDQDICNQIFSVDADGNVTFKNGSIVVTNNSTNLHRAIYNAGTVTCENLIINNSVGGCLEKFSQN